MYNDVLAEGKSSKKEFKKFADKAVKKVFEK